MAGHAFFAFILATTGARVMGAEIRHALLLGAAAGMFAVLPDVDMLYAWKEIVALFATGISGFVDSFWTASQATHRGISHSLVTAVGGATAFALMYTGRRWSAAFAVTGLLAGAFLFGGLLPLVVMGLFLAVGGGMTAFLRQGSELSGAELFAAALVGLASHPFGDVFTGAPPAFLSPFDVTLIAERVVLHPDPVINLLSVFLVELGTVVAGLSLFFVLTDRSFRDHIHPAAAIGLLYAGAVVLVPAPTLQVSYQFVYSLLLLGAATAAGVAVATDTTLTVIWNDVRTLYKDPLDQSNRRTVRVAVTGIITTVVGYSAYVVGYMIL